MMATQSSALLPPGRAGARVDEFGERARLCGIYDRDGAPVYHDLSVGDAHEIQEIVRAVRAIPGQVLDLAAGSGRLTLPLLALGREVTALDLSQDMLDLLAGRLEEAPARLRRRCTLVTADMSRFQLERQFAHVVLGTVSISLLDADARPGLYRSVRSHLLPGGQFLLSTLDRGAASGDSDETVLRVTGASGTPYDLHEYWPSGASSRTVTILPADPPPGPVPVCTGQVGTVGAALAEHELSEAGFEVLDRTELTGGGDRHLVTLLRAVMKR
ncbi:daptide-type RiPP biosynthesis methyltransferase [Micromonospora sp. SL4-19]|uniref:daptide-type RiPP biosynthesis methyltransferase n=1 Tax=Micromonospora sp. SL4-19 TaxID=3399129 RepID=UPI003A4D5B0B